MRYAVLASWSGSGPRALVLPVALLPGELRGRVAPLPLYAARWVEASLEAARASAPGGAAGALTRWRWERRLRRGLEAMGLPSQGLLWCEPSSLEAARQAAAEGREQAVARAMQGRLLLGSELARALGRPGQEPEPLLAQAEAWAAAGVARREAAVEIDAQGAVCRRCGARAGIYAEACSRCGSPFCPRCSRCAAMGLARGCEPLYAVEAPLLAAPSPGEPAAEDRGWSLDPAMAGGLSAAQRRAFDTLREQVARRLGASAVGTARGGLQGGQRAAAAGCVVWAVTGAGKTEVAFGAAEVALQMGGRVLFAAPRREIAAQVAARAARAFEGRPVRLLIGRPPGGGAQGAPACGGLAGADSALVVATTHQALRFYHAFSLVVLDEFDAFPYAGSDMLALAVDRAAHPDGFRVVMSATPGQDRLERARRAGWPVVHVPARHHGHPLPVPRIRVDPSMRRWEQAPSDPARVPAFVREWLESRAPATRALLFCPTVSLAEAVASAMGLPVCHSAHPARERTLACFAASRDGVLVSTTLLERGVTFPGLDVLVLFADHPTVFDEATLVQMAGRAGRAAERPDGRVLFAAATCSRAMEGAVRAIQEMNRLAAREGLLREGSVV